MYFLALSQAPPELALLRAIDTPDTRAPGNRPATQVVPNNIPTKKGVNNTRQPGRIISTREASVEILIHWLKSGLIVPSLISGLSFNYSLMFNTINLAALPTAFMVMAEKA